MCLVENGRLSDRYRIGTDTRCIILGVSYRIGIALATVVSSTDDITCITAGSSTVDGSHYTR